MNMMNQLLGLVFLYSDTGRSKFFLLMGKMLNKLKCMAGNFPELFLFLLSKTAQYKIGNTLLVTVVIGNTNTNTGKIITDVAYEAFDAVIACVRAFQACSERAEGQSEFIMQYYYVRSREFIKISHSVCCFARKIIVSSWLEKYYFLSPNSGFGHDAFKFWFGLPIGA